jgi:hypothetical protein
LNLSAIFSKTGKGVQEASGKTSQLSRGDRTVLSAIDGKTSLAEVQKKFEKLAGPKFEALIQQLDKDGFIREVSSGSASAAPTTRPAATPTRPAATPARPAPPPSGGDDDMDFTQAIKLPPRPAAPPPAAKPPLVDLAAASRAEAERKAKEQEAFNYKARQEAEAKAEAEAKIKARAAAEARVRAEAEARAKAEADAKAAAEAKGRADAEAKARAESDTRTRAESDAKVKAAREAALRMAADAKAKTDAAAEREREANERARKESEDKARLEADLNAKLGEERKAREDAERRAREAADQTRREIEEKAKRDAEELRLRLEAEMKAKLEEERKKREEEDRKRREEDERRRKEEDERRAKEDAERRAREEADKKRREEDDRRRKEEDERRTKEEAERRAKEEADKKRREEDEQKRRAEEDARRKADDERRAKDAAERRAKEEAERRARDEEDRKRRKEEDERHAKADAERRAKEDADRRRRGEDEAKARASQSASFPAIEPVSPAPPPAASSGSDIGDSLLADLDSFTQREDEEAKAKEEAERKAKEEAARKAKAEAERKAKEEADKKRREEEDRRRKEEEERRAQEEAERRAKEEEEQRRQEEAERKRKAKDALAAKQAEEKAKAAQRTSAAGKGAGDDDIGVSDEDLDMDDIKSDQKVLAKTARKAALEQPSVSSVTARRPRKWGKPAAIALFVLLIAGVGALQVMPISTAEYEKAASDAIGAPVKIASARLSVLTGVELRFEGVSVGSAVKIGLVRGSPEIGSLFGARKAFSRLELEGVSVSQSQLADAVLGKVSGDNFRVGRIVIKQAKLDGPLALPAMDIEAAVSGDGSLQSVKLTGGDKLSVQLSPKGKDIGFEISAASLALPFVPALTLVDFGMKGTANRDGVTTSEFDGRAFDGVISGTAKIRWGANWNVDGEVKVRAVKVAVFAPALVSEGKVEGRAAYSMSGSTPAGLYEGARVQGDFKIEQGVLGSFDLTRALQTGGAQTSGRTIFSELTGQGVYDKGAIQIRNVAITAGAMNAGASLDIDANGGLSGRIAADVKAATQTLRATLNLSGKVQDPVIRK